MSGPIRVLVVEDEEIAAEAHAEYVRRVDGFELAAVARTGSEALALLGISQSRQADQVPVDLVLLDMNLPDGNGLTLARELSAGGVTAGQGRPVVVAVTASVLPQDRAAALEAGCDAFLDKPYAAADLVAVVAEHLPRS